MFGWLRDALTNAPSSFGYHHPMTPSSLFHQQKQKYFISNNEEINQLNENSFYHNPYHSSGQMNYVDFPQQQYTNQHNYPTYLARQQTSDSINQTLDEQIQNKLLSLKQRSNNYQSYYHRQNSYAFRNKNIITTATPRSSFIYNEQISDEDEDENDEDERSSSIETYHGITGYYSGQYSNIDEQFDFASVVVWYKNVMKSVQKFL
jgi:hypothetical protein